MKIQTYFIHLHSSPAETSESREKPRPTAEAPLCELQGPHGAPSQLRPATAGILTLTSGSYASPGALEEIMSDSFWFHDGSEPSLVTDLLDRLEVLGKLRCSSRESSKSSFNGCSLTLDTLDSMDIINRCRNFAQLPRQIQMTSLRLAARNLAFTRGCR